MNCSSDESDWYQTYVSITEVEHVLLSEGLLPDILANAILVLIHLNYISDDAFDKLVFHFLNNIYQRLRLRVWQELFGGGLPSTSILLEVTWQYLWNYFQERNKDEWRKESVSWQSSSQCWLISPIKLVKWFMIQIIFKNNYLWRLIGSHICEHCRISYRLLSLSRSWAYYSYYNYCSSIAQRS